MRKHIMLAVLAVAALPVLAHAEGNVANGEKVFRKCKACHDAEAKKNKIGPYLVGVVGRKAASVDGYHYSDAMKAKGAEGVVWDEATLDTYLKKPKDFVPGTKMTFFGLPKEQERLDVIAYLKSKSQ